MTSVVKQCPPFIYGDGITNGVVDHVEGFITCLLLVKTGYRSKEHDMERLLKQAIGFDKEFNTVFPRHNKAELHLFELLRHAYVDACHNKSCKITDHELDVLGKRVQEIKAIVDRVCRKKVEELKKMVSKSSD
jgi:uncharacterized protein